MGAGWNRAEFEAMGLPFDHRASRFVESFEIIRRLLAGEHVTFEGRWQRANDAVLLPVPAKTTLMIGSTGPRVLEAALPFVDAWNTWFDWFGNTPEGFAEANSKIDGMCERVGRNPASLMRSACVLVQIGPDAVERPPAPDVTPLTGSREQMADGLQRIAEAGAGEVIAVLDPITEESIRVLGEIVRLAKSG
jgi:alkanesulfonate monooxygenase SsuD/methylene tetrahydromethanopterin reductase-like flavin-dependent oxidoreductase (luciferase family)